MLKSLCVFMLMFTCVGLTAAETTNSFRNTAATSAVLYYNHSCPHCKTVLKYLSQNNKTLSMKNTSNQKYKEELRRHGQKGVPTLVVGSKVVVGATPIINYLKQHPEVLR